MIVEVERDGRRHAVEVRRDGDRWLVTLGDRQLDAHVSEIGGRWSLLIGQASYEIAIEPRSGGAHAVHVNGRAIQVTVVNGVRRRRLDGTGRSAGLERITAPMPGRIVKVLVRQGDTVEPRQPLVVVEAMKMENELRASRAGIVADVRVGEGMSIEAGAVLVVIE